MKSEKIPSDPIRSIALRRHARRRAWQPEAPDALPLRSPAAGFPLTAGSTPRSTPQPPSDRSRMLATAFPSPATAARFRASIPGSMVPACCFASPPAVSAARSAFRSATAPGSPRVRPLPRFRPVAASSADAAGCASRLHSSSGLLPPSGSKRSAEFAARRLASRFRPISLRSPPPSLSLVLPAPDHRFRSATFPLACCSSNLLEPVFKYAPAHSSGQRFSVRESAVFLRLFQPCFEPVTALAPWIRCG